MGVPAMPLVVTTTVCLELGRGDSLSAILNSNVAVLPSLAAFVVTNVIAPVAESRITGPFHVLLPAKLVSAPMVEVLGAEIVGRLIPASDPPKVTVNTF